MQECLSVSMRCTHASTPCLFCTWLLVAAWLDSHRCADKGRGCASSGEAHHITTAGGSAERQPIRLGLGLVNIYAPDLDHRGAAGTDRTRDHNLQHTQCTLNPGAPCSLSVVPSGQLPVWLCMIISAASLGTPQLFGFRRQRRRQRVPWLWAAAACSCGATSAA
jgi:hypothetical protein